MLLITHTRRGTRIAIVALALVLLTPAAADAASSHGPLVMGAIPILGPILNGLGGIFGSIGGAVLGAFTWTIGLATNFLLTTIAALVHLLIPHSWLHKGLEIMEWIVSVPDYGAKIVSPGGGHAYGFPGVNELRGVFGWLGIAIAPLTLVYATSRAMIGEGDPVGVPVLRTVAIGAVIVSYPYWWDQGAALVNQITHVILSLPDVSAGLYKLMEYAVGGVALGGWQLIDLGLMGAVAIELLGLIFMKVVVILLGAWLYTTGPLMIGLVPTRQGSALARAWMTAVIGVLALGVAWASLFAVGAVLINDSSTAGPLVAGNTGFGNLIGGVLLAVAGLASLWLCLKVAREAGSLLRMQLGGLLVMGSGRGTSSATASTGGSRMQQTTGRSLRDYSRRLSAATGGAAGELAFAAQRAGPAGTAAVRGGRALGQVGRRGLIGTAAAGARTAGGAAAPTVAATFSRSRAGAVAVQMGRAGTAGWQQEATAQKRANDSRGRSGQPDSPAGSRNGSSKVRDGRQRADRGDVQGQVSARVDRVGNGARPSAPVSTARRVGAPRGSQSGSKPIRAVSATGARWLAGERPASAGSGPVSPPGSRQGRRAGAPVGARPNPVSPPAGSRRRFGLRRSPAAGPPPAVSRRDSVRSVTPVVPGPRARRPWGARFSRPFHNRKAGQ